MVLLLVALLGGAAWSTKEAGKLVGALMSTMSTPDEMNISLRPENLRLARFAYASFDRAPGYASHAHVDPELENRLLDRPSLKLMAANAEAAAPRARQDSDLDTLPRLAQSGLWTGSSVSHKPTYVLTPPLRLESGQRYALRLEFLNRDQEGVLQITHAALFREYLLPDSGVGISAVPLSFGSLPTSSRVAALEQNSGAAIEPKLLFVAPKFSGEQLDFARFWLFTYDSSNLPVRVSSWIPYRAETETAVPAFLETPRIWQRGWQATVNGQRVSAEESPQHLVMVPLEPGASEVVLTFRAPLWLTGWFWLCLTGWMALAAWGTRGIVRQAWRPEFSPADPTAPRAPAGSGP